MRNFLSRRAVAAGLISGPVAASPLVLAQELANVTADLPSVEFERYLAFLQQEVRALLAARFPDSSPNWLPVCWVPEGFQHPSGPAMRRARAVLMAAGAM